MVTFGIRFLSQNILGEGNFVIVGLDHLSPFVRVGIGGEEYWILLEDGSNSYSIKSTYKVLLGSRFDSSEVDIFKTLWEIKIPLKCSIIWNLWFQGNDIVFEGKQLDCKKVWHKTMFFVWTWLKALQKDFPTTYQMWQVDLRASMENFKFIC
ncbi:hypothetical protein JHK82_011418 [Glycine max]|uniref:Reverse transcriptase zinc-binding domain-containing protein n=1 Tax=Glycine max TaxID=3847 RepID=A0A0R0JYF3_SOYBN|nr:hypothetical protein JHK85_011735 [Glycine max]KAG5056413.1 hypothetical protein JHK86_011409 [Glycine max]KAG5153449.1 hypothetical protein JHK82_011418 [Glycine max]KAH1132172.1 hypothetical protein GYH30_011170 [Glycine max]